jgi:hypothetical protein
MPSSSLNGPNEQSKGNQAPGRQSDNALLAFGSETGDPASVEWVPAGAKTGLQRLAEMSWRADTEEVTGSISGPSRTRLWAIMPALVLAGVLVAAYFYVAPIYSPMTPPVEHPRIAAELIRPVPLPNDTLELPPVRPPVSQATPAATTGPTSPRPEPSSPTGRVSVSPAGRGPISPAGRGPISPAGHGPISPARPGPISPTQAAAPSQPDSAVSDTSPPAAVAVLGSLSINAMPWADVWIDGKSVGQTPIANLQVSLGPHEVVFRHPLLGEQRHTVQVGGLAPARLSVDLRRSR